MFPAEAISGEFVSDPFHPPQLPLLSNYHVVLDTRCGGRHAWHMTLRYSKLPHPRRTWNSTPVSSGFDPGVWMSPIPPCRARRRACSFIFRGRRCRPTSVRCNWKICIPPRITHDSAKVRATTFIRFGSGIYFFDAARSNPPRCILSFMGHPGTN